MLCVCTKAIEIDNILPFLTYKKGSFIQCHLQYCWEGEILHKVVRKGLSEKLTYE